MHSKSITRILAPVLLTAVLALPVHAILGLGDIVFDPTSYAELVTHAAQLAQQYGEMVLTYALLQVQYQHLQFMSQKVPVNMLTRYLAVASPWINSAARDVYGTTGGWTTGINSGLGVSPGYSLATRPLNVYGALGSIPGLSRIQTDYATVELTDGANIAGMQTLGDIRANAPAVETAIQNVESDSLSSDPDMNTQVAVLNKINAANVISLRNTQDANKLLTTLAEEEIIDAKRKRDAEAQAFDDHIQFMAEGQAALTSQGAGLSDAMIAWRMP